MSDRFDMIVIGSGPGGIAAAIYGVQAGIRALLITDREESALSDARHDDQEPMQSVHPGALSLLGQLKVEGVISYAARGTYTGIETNGFFSPLSTVPGEIWTGYHILPGRFEAFTVHAAKEQGVHVLHHTKVDRILHNDQHATGVLTADRRTIYCTYIIDATGRKRLAGKFFGLKELLLSPPLVSWTGNSQVSDDEHLNRQKACFIPQADSWTWKAYSDADLYTWTTLALQKNAERIGQVIANREHIGRLRGADMQWRVFRPVVKPGLLLAGDAAGVLDPAAGQGILNALMSGMMAAHTVVKCRKEPQLAGDHLIGYDKWFITQFEKKAVLLKENYEKLGIKLFEDMKGGI